MLNRVLPFGLARNCTQAELSFDRHSSGSNPVSIRRVTDRAAPRVPSRRMFEKQDAAREVLPEDVIVVILGYLTVAEIMVIRRCSKWFKDLTENRQIWASFISHPYFPTPIYTSDQSSQALEALVQRQFEMSRTWSPKTSTTTPIPIRHSLRCSMPNNESLTAMSSMNSWVAVASDLGGVYVCAPFGRDIERGLSWIRVLSVPVQIKHLAVMVWDESGCQRVAVMWAGQANTQNLEFQCGIAVAASEDLVAAQGRAQGGIVLSTSNFVSSSIMELRNTASEIMDIAIGERYCAIIDAAHVIQTFMHRSVDNELNPILTRSEVGGIARSSRKTISLQFLPRDQLHVQSDSFIAVYMPISPVESTMVSKYFTRLPSTHYFGLLTHRRSSTIVSTPDYMSVPVLALGDNGTEITHFDLRFPASDAESSETNDYGLSHRRSVSYMLVPWLRPFALGAVNGGHSRLVWIASCHGRFLGIALGRLCVGNGDPVLSYHAPLNRTTLDMGEYGEALVEQSPSGPLFVFHEGEGRLFGGIQKTPDLFMLAY